MTNTDMILAHLDAIRREVALGQVKKPRKKSGSVARIIAKNEERISKLGNKQK